MKVQFRLAKKRWSLEVKLTSTRLFLLVAMTKMDADQIVQFILPFLN